MFMNLEFLLKRFIHHQSKIDAILSTFLATWNCWSLVKRGFLSRREICTPEHTYWHGILALCAKMTPHWHRAVVVVVVVVEVEAVV